MPKTSSNPADVLKSLMEEYQLNPFSLSKKIGLSTSAVRQIAIGESRVTVPTALRLAKFFDQCPSFWLDIQLQADMQAAADDKELQAALKGIQKTGKPPAAKAPAGKPTAKEKPKAKPVKKAASADKRKEAAKAPAAKSAARKPAGKK